MHRFVAVSALLVALSAAAPAAADSWSLSPINPTMNAGWTPTLAIDAGLHPHVAYWNPGINYASFDGTAWQNETIPAIALPYLSAVARPAGSELIITWETHMVLTPDGTPWIAYSMHNADHSYQDLLVVSHETNGAWVNEIIDQPIGSFSLVAAASGTLWLAYRSLTLGPTLAIRPSQRDRRRRNGPWTSEPLPVGVGPLAIDRQGALWSTSGGYITRRDGPSTWTSTQVDTGSFCGPLQLQFDAANRPHAAYSTYESNSVFHLRHAAWNGTGWDHESIPAAGNKAVLRSFTLDGAGNPFLAYQDQNNLDTDVAHRSGGTWVIDVVDAYGNSGTYASLITDPLGRPWMAYQANSGLWLARTELPVGVGDPTAGVASVRVALQGANPARAGVVARLRIESPHAGEIRIETFDVSGRRLGGVREWNVTAGTTELPWTAPATPGLCLVRATPGDGRPASARVMVIR